MQTDYVQRFLFEELDIRGRLLCLTGAWQRMLDGRDYPEDIASLLGHTTAEYPAWRQPEGRGPGHAAGARLGAGQAAGRRLHGGAADPRHGALPERRTAKNQ